MTTLLTTCLLACNFVSIYSGIEYYSQKDYFESLSDYYYVNTGFEYTEVTEENEIKDAKYKYKFYQEFHKNQNAPCQVYFGNLTDDTDMIYINKNNLSYLLEAVPELGAKDFNEDKMYYIFPEKIYNSDDFDFQLETLDDWTKWQLEINYNYQYEYATLDYSANTKIIAIGGDFSMRSGYLKNPIIIYNNMEESLDDYEITSDVRGVFDKDIMYKLDDKTLGEIWDNSEFEPNSDYFEISNVYEEYIDHWTALKRIAYINIIISLLMIILEVIIISVIIRLEYSVNEVELIVKKILGYSLLERHKRLFFISLIISISCILIAVVVNCFIGFTNNIFLLVCGLIQIAIETLVIRVCAKRSEKRSIQKVLKGG